MITRTINTGWRSCHS